ncbi:MAG: hypothetical protein KZQ66_08420 [Candidatus Thiodiazotropha sp. (ex Lucinoma aequizonata)]|nr:hypothetical protein [Candidatus Thiodiazotropha sp. (ex Lucinoma aequizonata)]MCU7889504.1 hypothetical protein [Candidatus Thiodiazotropha sp. (ex Lucinoma aequizonata)]MCU7894630.1 hypothetical protein [Candidatus Thiodiazotropha sp. (ex Lucinoma aequizonata)]MCU7897890.1 hypothetical protein [Candidatus Thiodiazotropha sp. (ex Lucinoma aequizonata)]MCU7902013.1 hypothetical protein [Candidatus Thiodiazotropha sp. (ex Lucinoma aequizonata)]
MAVEESLTPVYSTTEGVHQLTLRGFMQQVLARLELEPEGLCELLPQTLLGRFRLPNLVLVVSYLVSER